jgi:hypothetical protein
LGGKPLPLFNEYGCSGFAAVRAWVYAPACWQGPRGRLKEEPSASSNTTNLHTIGVGSVLLCMFFSPLVSTAVSDPSLTIEDDNNDIIIQALKEGMKTRRRNTRRMTIHFDIDTKNRSRWLP